MSFSVQSITSQLHQGFQNQKNDSSCPYNTTTDSFLYLEKEFITYRKSTSGQLGKFQIKISFYLLFPL